jgi:hypothetical protein
MADAAEQLAATIRRVIYGATQAALRSQRVPEPSLPPLEPPPKLVEDKQTEGTTERMLDSLKEVQQTLPSVRPLRPCPRLKKLWPPFLTR